MKTKFNGHETKLSFISKYAAFSAELKFNLNGHLEIFSVKNNKCPLYPWGLPGGKEEKIDKRNPVKTFLREFGEETGLKSRNKYVSYFQNKRRNNLYDPSFGIINRYFINYFMVSFQKVEPSFIPKISQKESIDGMAWFLLSDFENQKLKQNHRIAFIELCYWLEENFAKNDQILSDDLKKCSYLCFEKPSITGGVFMFKWHEDTKTEYSQKMLPYILDNSSIRGLKIFANPMCS